MSFKEKTLKTLEFDKIRALLAEIAPTDGAKERALALCPSDDAVEIRRRMTRTTDAKRLAQIKGMPAFSGVNDVGDALERAEKIADGRAVLVMMHFPPRMEEDPQTLFTDILEAHTSVKTVVYGHLHGPAFAAGFAGECRGIRYYPVSCDGIDFRPLEIPWPEI